MSRIGQKPVKIASGAKVSVSGNTINVEGPKGKLSYQHRPEVGVTVEADEVQVTRSGDDRPSKAFQGLTRALVANMIVGVTEGYERKLEVVGVGYLVSLAGDSLKLRVGLAKRAGRQDSRRANRYLPRPNAHCGSGLRQAAGWRLRRKSACVAKA